MNKLFILGHFELRILKTDEGLNIEAENQQTSQLFLKTLTEDSVKSLNRDPFFDLATIYQVLQDFFGDRPQSVSLVVSDEGKLTYSCHLSFGSVTKEMGFSIQLEKQKIDPLKKMEKTMVRLSSRISQLEEQLNTQVHEPAAADSSAVEKLEKSLKDFEITILKKIEQLESKMEKRIQILEEKVGSLPNSDIPHFENNLSHFYISNENKTAESHSQGFLMAQEPFNMNQAARFSLHIENNNAKLLGFGIAPGYLKQSQHLSTLYPFHELTCYMYYSAGNVWKNGTSHPLNLPIPQNDDVFAIAFEPLEGKLIVYQNNKQVDTHIYGKELLGSNILYPFVYVGGKDIKVSFVEN